MATGTKGKKTARRKKRKSGKKILFGLTSRVLMVIAAGLMALSYVSFVVNPAKFWLITLFGLAFVPLLLTNIILLVWAAVRRSRSFIIPLVAVLPCVFFLGRYVQFSIEDVDPETEADLRVISYNLGRFSMDHKRSGIDGRSQCADSVFAFLRSQDADIICLQELYLGKDDALKVNNYVKKHLPGYHAEYYLFHGRYGSFGNMTLSRYPVSGKGVLKFEESANLAIYTDHRVGERRFRVYNCHFESYNISFSGMIRSLFRADGDAFSETGLKVKRSISRRPKQVDKVFSNIEECPYEAFVCGDFNDNPMSYTYHRMARGRKDAFVKGGSGFGGTYSFLWPMLRIDYILVPDRFRTRECEVRRLMYSDHYPVIADIDF